MFFKLASNPSKIPFDCDFNDDEIDQCISVENSDSQSDISCSPVARKRMIMDDKPETITVYDADMDTFIKTRRKWTRRVDGAVLHELFKAREQTLQLHGLYDSYAATREAKPKRVKYSIEDKKLQRKLNRRGLESYWRDINEWMNRQCILMSEIIDKNC